MDPKTTKQIESVKARVRTGLFWFNPKVPATLKPRLIQWSEWTRKFVVPQIGCLHPPYDLRARVLCTHLLDISVSEWQRCGHYGNTTLETRQVDYILRLRAKDLDRSDFEHDFEARDRPLIITSALKKWPASSKWSIEKLSERFGNTKFKVGEVWNVFLPTCYFVLWLATLIFVQLYFGRHHHA